MRIQSIAFLASVFLVSFTSPLFAESKPSDSCLTLQLTIHNQTKQAFSLSFPNQSPEVQFSTILKPAETTTLQANVKIIQVIGYLSFSVNLGRDKSFHIMDPFNTYQGVFSVTPDSGSENLEFTINQTKMNDPSLGTCLFVNAADISITYARKG